MQSKGDAAASDSSQHASPIGFWELKELSPDLMRFRQGFRGATQGHCLSRALYSITATHKGQVRFPHRRTCPFLHNHNFRPGDCGPPRIKGKGEGTDGKGARM